MSTTKLDNIFFRKTAFIECTFTCNRLFGYIFKKNFFKFEDTFSWLRKWKYFLCSRSQNPDHVVNASFWWKISIYSGFLELSMMLAKVLYDSYKGVFENFKHPNEATWREFPISAMLHDSRIRRRSSWNNNRRRISMQVNQRGAFDSCSHYRGCWYFWSPNSM